MATGRQTDRGTVRSFTEMDEAAKRQKLSLRQRAFEILEHSRRRDVASRVIDDLLVILILGNVAVVVAQTIPEVANQFGNTLFVFDRICVLIFAVEYAARIWVAPEHPMLSDKRELVARVRFAGSPLMVIDALALVPWILEVLYPHSNLILLTRLVRLLKLARYSPAIATIGRVIAAERRALLACVIILSGVLLTCAAVMLAIEGDKQPERLGDMSKTIWWAAAMLAKIGGGETEPVTVLGRIVAAITVMLGIFCFALPVAIIGRGFYEEIRRRDFVVTFAMVARVPLFSTLDAASIADLVNMLRARTVAAGTVLIRQGDPGDAMYFVASGTVEVTTKTLNVRLSEGDFFGEMALLSRGPRTATVTALSSTDLLVLEVDDFLRLLDRLPAVKKQVEGIAASRDLG